MKRVLFLLLLLSSLGFGQSVTVTGVVQTSTGALATNGYVEFDISPQNSSTIYRVPASTIVVPQKGQCAINSSGQIKQQDPQTKLATSNPCLVWGNDIIVPSNTLYTIKFAPNNQISIIINNVDIFGSAVNLQTPTLMNPQPVVGTQIYANPIVVMTVQPSVNNSWSLGDPQHYFLNLYVRNINFINQQFLNGWTCQETSQPANPLPNFWAEWCQAGVGLSMVNNSGTVYSIIPYQHAANTVWGNNGSSTAPDADVKVTYNMTDQSTIAPIDSPTFTGDPKAPTPATGDNDTSIATTAWVKLQNYITALTAPVTSVNGQTGDVSLAYTDITGLVAQLALKANLASPTFTGDPKAPTPSPGDNDTSLATTAFVNTAISSTVGFTKFQAVKKTSSICSTGTGSYDNCTTVLTWGTAFADANYIPVCSGKGPNVNSAKLNISTYDASTITVTIQNGTSDGAVAATFSEVDCQGVYP